MQLTEKDVQILTQVAFKEASAQLVGADLETPEGKAKFESLALYLTDTLVNLIEVSVEKHRSSAAAPAAAPAYSGAVTNAPSTSGGYTVTIKGTAHGPIPDWAIKQCQEKGVNEVYDNRDRLAENPKLPWFKSTSGDIPIWAPRKGK